MTRSRSRFATLLALAGALLGAGLALIIYGLVTRHPQHSTVALPRSVIPTAAARTGAPTTPPRGHVALSAAGFHYVGKWQIVRHMDDGRYAGMSARSFVPGAKVVIPFLGRAIRLYGVAGPGGGSGRVSIDGIIVDPAVSFRAPDKRTHVLVFAIDTLARGRHELTITVNRPPPPSQHAYVNVDAAAYQL